MGLGLLCFRSEDGFSEVPLEEIHVEEVEKSTQCREQEEQTTQARQAHKYTVWVAWVYVGAGEDIIANVDCTFWHIVTILNLHAVIVNEEFALSWLLILRHYAFSGLVVEKYQLVENELLWVEQIWELHILSYSRLGYLGLHKRTFDFDVRFISWDSLNSNPHPTDAVIKFGPNIFA